MAVSIFSPELKGIPTAPTAKAGTDTKQIATTEFVLANSPVPHPQIMTRVTIGF